MKQLALILILGSFNSGSIVIQTISKKCMAIKYYSGNTVKVCQGKADVKKLRYRSLAAAKELSDFAYHGKCPQKGPCRNFFPNIMITMKYGKFKWVTIKDYRIQSYKIFTIKIPPKPRHRGSPPTTRKR